MIPIVFINCHQYPFIDEIIQGRKVYETRTRNTLAGLLGKTVLIAETGRGKPTVRCIATIRTPLQVTSAKQFEKYRTSTRIEKGSEYDWTDKTRVKYLYKLENVRSFGEFVPENGKRHGRVWMEYNGQDIPGIEPVGIHRQE